MQANPLDTGSGHYFILITWLANKIDLPSCEEGSISLLTL